MSYDEAAGGAVKPLAADVNSIPTGVDPLSAAGTPCEDKKRSLKKFSTLIYGGGYITAGRYYALPYGLSIFGKKT